MKARVLALAVSGMLATGCLVHLIDHMTGEDRAKEIRPSGQSAMARVVRIWDTGMTLNGNPVVGFRLEVRPEGAEPFEAETKAVVGRLDVPQVQPGALLPVKYDPNDHTRVALDVYER